MYVGEARETVLIMASRHGLDDVVSLILARQDVDANARDCEGKAAIAHAAKDGKMKVRGEIFVTTDN